MFQRKSSTEKVMGGIFGVIGCAALIWSAYCLLTNQAPIFFEGVFVESMSQFPIVGEVESVKAVKEILDSSERRRRSFSSGYLPKQTRTEIEKGNAVKGLSVSPRTVRWVDVTFWANEKQEIFINLLDSAPTRIQHDWAVGTGMSINPTLRLHMFVDGVEWVFQGPLTGSGSNSPAETSALSCLQKHCLSDGVLKTEGASVPTEAKKAVITEQGGVLLLRFTDDSQFTLEELEVLKQQEEKLREMFLPGTSPTTNLSDVLQERFAKTPFFPNLFTAITPRFFYRIDR